MPGAPELKQFRTERSPNGVLHLVFDMPGRSMNVFSNAAIEELGRFADWLPQSDVAGVVIRSGKASAFCAGADLAELETAYDMIMAAPAAERDRVAFDHFFRLSQGLRKLETAGKPVAVAIAGLALGGGAEFALAAHYRVITDQPQSTFGLPESLVGLLPGGGGTQRLPRLIGIEAALPVLLDGARIGGAAAIAVGLADELVAPGEEVAAAERWVLSRPPATQPWDRPDWRAKDAERFAAQIGQRRASVLAETLGHYPAPLAILDCVEQGFPQRFRRCDPDRDEHLCEADPEAGASQHDPDVVPWKARLRAAEKERDESQGCRCRRGDLTRTGCPIGERRRARRNPSRGRDFASTRRRSLPLMVGSRVQAIGLTTSRRRGERSSCALASLKLKTWRQAGGPSLTRLSAGRPIICS